MNIKSISKKLIICLIVFLLLFNFIISSINKYNIVLAAEDEQTDEEIAQEAEEEADNLFGGILNGLAGILTWIPRALINVTSMLSQTLAYFVIDTAGHGTNDVSVLVTPFDIFFNKFTLTNINIFQTDDLENTSGGNLVRDIRENAAMLYYIVRAIAIGVLFIMLLLVLIKMALATLAEEKARLKGMFGDWVVSVVLVLLLHFIIMAIITINESLVGIIENVADSANISDMVSSLRTAAFSINFLLGWGATIAYAIMAIQTMIFAFSYIIRMFKVVFLIVISPIMPLTYSLDRAKGGQAKALNGWLREFCYNVFIQVIHCIIYVVILSIPLSALGSVTIGSLSGLSESILLIIAMLFVKKAEELLKTLFGFDRSSTLTSYSSVVNNAQKAVMTGISVANGTYTVTNNVANNTTTFGSNIQTLGQRASTKVHEFRDKAATWLEGQEEAMGTYNTSEGSSDSNESQPKDDDYIDADYVEIDDEESESNDEQAGYVPMLLPDLSSEAADRLAEAVTSTQHNDDDINSENIDINQEDIDENEEQEEHSEEEIIEKRPLSDEEKQQREELKNLYQKLLDEVKEANEAQKEIQTKLDDLAEKLDEDKTEELTSQIQEIFAKEGAEAAAKYAASLGETAEGAFAKEYVNYLNNQRNLQQLLDAGEGKLINTLNDSVEDGTIDSEEAMALYNNARNVINGQKDRTDEIINVEDNNQEDEKPEIEVVEGEVVDITKDLGLSKKTINSVLTSTRRATIENSKILDAIEGEIKVEGDFTNANMLTFNTKILEKARSGAYNESNFRRAEEAVKKEGDIAVRRLEKFKAEQSEANARMLTPAGKKYAELMVEAQQAGMFIASAGLYEKSTSSEYRSQNTTVRNQIVNNMPQTPTNSSNNVLNDLNNRKKYA